MAPTETHLVATIVVGFVGMLINSLNNSFLLSFVITLGSALLVCHVFMLQFSMMQLSETIREENYMLYRQFEYLVTRDGHNEIQRLEQELANVTQKYTDLLLHQKQQQTDSSNTTDADDE